MDVGRARYFMEVARYQSMTKAAQSLHVAEPAISQAMKRFADEVGFALFRRKGRNIELTEEGRALYEKLGPLLAQIDQIPEEIQGQEHPSQNIRIYAPSCKDMARQAMDRYSQSHPGVEFELVEERDGDWDVCLTSLGEKGIRLVEIDNPALRSNIYVMTKPCGEALFKEEFYEYMIRLSEGYYERENSGNGR